MNEIELVRDFYARQVLGDLDGVASLMSDDVVVAYTGMAATHSKAEWRDRAGAYDASLGFKVDIVTILGDGQGHVMVEHVDSFRRTGGWIDMQIAGAFTIRDGLIVGYREYFDVATFTNRLAALDQEASEAFRTSHLGGA